MGLDTVELVLAMKDEFGIPISDTAAERIISVRDAVDHFAAEMGKREGTADRDDIFMRVRAVTAEISNIPLESITLETRFVDDLGLD